MFSPLEKQKERKKEKGCYSSLQWEKDEIRSLLNSKNNSPRGESRGGGAGGMNWEIGMDIHTLICIK